MCISVTSHALDPLPLSQTVTPSRTPLERDVLYGRPLDHRRLIKTNWIERVKIQIITQPDNQAKVYVVVSYSSDLHVHVHVTPGLPFLSPNAHVGLRRTGE